MDDKSNIGRKGFGKMKNLEQLMNTSFLFHDIELDSRHLIFRKLRKGQMVTDHMQNKEYVGTVTEGILDVYSVALDGKEVRLSTLENGDSFGICNLFLRNELTTVLRAREISKIVMIPKDILLEHLQSDSKLMMRYMKLYNEKIQFLLHRIEELTMQSSRGRLIEYLNDHVDEKGCVNLTESRDELANHLGVSRATLFREIASLKKQNLICSRDGKIYILS